MRLKHLLSAAAAICLVLPAAGVAAPSQADAQPQHSGRDQSGTATNAPAHPVAIHPVVPAHPIAGRPIVPKRPVGPVHPIVPVHPVGPIGGPPVVRKPPVFRRLPPRPPINIPGLSGWNRGGPGWDRNRAGQEWRARHGGWDHNAPWRHRRDWWRHHRAWRFYFGERVGFFFIPAFGYVSVPVEYRTHYWRAGEYLPNWFWRFQVREYWDYGLPRPPDGCMWVWVSNDVALVDMSDGYILDIVHNAW